MATTMVTPSGTVTLTTSFPTSTSSTNGNSNGGPFSVTSHLSSFLFAAVIIAIALCFACLGCIMSPRRRRLLAARRRAAWARNGAVGVGGPGDPWSASGPWTTEEFGGFGAFGGRREVEEEKKRPQFWDVEFGSEKVGKWEDMLPLSAFTSIPLEHLTTSTATSLPNQQTQTQAQQTPFRFLLPSKPSSPPPTNPQPLAQPEPSIVQLTVLVALPSSQRHTKSSHYEEESEKGLGSNGDVVFGVAEIPVRGGPGRILGLEKLKEATAEGRDGDGDVWR
ncbi:hypothetical protein JAAARDRAFT_34289 [Jaapia argillacea MUCL 33604]|uniref:Uncharacterized protein n=1 Tax=Jaapia argillacea MUCL 33604 TaxID=933084 RepID=A0A067PX88_9AGAM|nr:hypothetical protein JAAARDRAFT_34289 [Jaapia argillacea MUCL 33604]